MAVIAESARWGDAHLDTPRTKNDDWLWALDRVKSGFLAKRTDILQSQLEAAGSTELACLLGGDTALYSML